MTAEVLVRVSPEILDLLSSADSPPVVILAITELGDGTHEMILRSVDADLTRAEIEIARAENAEREVKRLRQGLWDCAATAGADTDGDTTPDHLASDIVEYAQREVRELREVYEEALRDAD